MSLKAFEVLKHLVEAHPRALSKADRATLEDLDSKNGSFVDGVRVSAPTPLKSGESIRIGPFTLLFKISGELASTETEIATRSSD